MRVFGILQQTNELMAREVSWLVESRSWNSPAGSTKRQSADLQELGA
jgi:hypothetical protein